MDTNSSVIVVEGYAVQLQGRAVSGVPAEVVIDVGWIEKGGTYSDGSGYSLRKPIATIPSATFGLPGSDVSGSRLTPTLIGLGLLESASTADTRMNDDFHDRDATASLVLPPRSRPTETLCWVRSDDESVIAGEYVCDGLGRAACHTKRWETGSHAIEPLADQVIYPYTDLLLHDMRR